MGRSHRKIASPYTSQRAVEHCGRLPPATDARAGWRANRHLPRSPTHEARWSASVNSAASRRGRRSNLAASRGSCLRRTIRAMRAWTCSPLTSRSHARGDLVAERHRPPSPGTCGAGEAEQVHRSPLLGDDAASAEAEACETSRAGRRVLPPMQHVFTAMPIARSRSATAGEDRSFRRSLPTTHHAERRRRQPCPEEEKPPACGAA